MAAVPLKLNDLITLQCGACGVVHAIPAAMHDCAVREGGFWHCPNGHSRGYGKGTQAAKLDALQRELDAERERKAAALARANRAELAVKRIEARSKREHKRQAAGVCPCCNRTFSQLARHMKAKHPDHGDQP